MLTFLLISSAFIMLYVIRNVAFCIYALFYKRRDVYDFVDLNDNQLPTLTIIIPAHNEELVIEGCLKQMLTISYPEDKLEIYVINDRSSDRTREIIEDFIAKNDSGKKINLFNRPFDAIAGKPAAINDLLVKIESEAVIIFDADYMPYPNLARKLVTPLIDPEVGVTMGKVIAYNSDSNLLTRLLDLERKAGYTIDQRVRENLSLFVQFGGTTGAIKMSALRDIGGLRHKSLAEDTDLTIRMYLKDWKARYLDYAACYEEVPEKWSVRYRQIKRWAMGHNQCLFRYLIPILLKKDLSLLFKIDAFLILCIYLVPSLSLINMILFFVYQISFNQTDSSFIAFILFCGLSMFGTITYFQMIVASFLDKQIRLIKFIPLIFISSTLNIMANFSALVTLISTSITKKNIKWDKTTRFRKAAQT